MHAADVSNACTAVMGTRRATTALRFTFATSLFSPSALGFPIFLGQIWKGFLQAALLFV